MFHQKIFLNPVTFEFYSKAIAQGAFIFWPLHIHILVWEF